MLFIYYKSLIYFTTVKQTVNRYMTNHEIAKIFFEIGEILANQGVAHKPRVYQNAAVIIDSLSKSLQDIYNEGGIDAIKCIPGIGDGMAQKIEECLLTNKLDYYVSLKTQI